MDKEIVPPATYYAGGELVIVHLPELLDSLLNEDWIVVQLLANVPVTPVVEALVLAIEAVKEISTSADGADQVDEPDTLLASGGPQIQLGADPAPETTQASITASVAD